MLPIHRFPSLSNQRTELCIIGGGIYGAALLWEATHRGLDATLIEKNDFGSGVSSNVLKTIDGGFRCLQRAAFKRTIEAHREKLILKKVAPELIRPLTVAAPSGSSPFTHPAVYRATSVFMNTLGSLSARGLQDVMSEFEPMQVRELRSVWKRGALPEATDFLLWDDAQCVSTERLLMSYVQAAKAKGAHAYNYSTVRKVVSMSDEEGFYVEYKNEVGGREKLRANWVVDCTNSDQLSMKQLRRVDPSVEKDIEYLPALNLVLRGELSDYALMLKNPLSELGSKGLLLVSPWRGTTLAGTWYFEPDELSSKFMIEDQVIANCIGDIADSLKASGLEISESKLHRRVIDVQLGLLPAKQGSAAPESRLLKTNKCWEVRPGHWIMQGVEYSAARTSAVKMVNKLASKDEQVTKSCSHIFKLDDQILKAQRKKNKANNKTIPGVLFERYGSVANLFASEAGDAEELVEGSERLYKCEVNYLIKHEQVKRLDDLLYRRLNINSSQRIKTPEIEGCAELLAKHLNWSNDERAKHVALAVNFEKRKVRLSQSA